MNRTRHLTPLHLALAALLLAGCAADVPVQPDAWTAANGYRWRELAVAGTRPGFTSVRGTGIDFVNRLSDTAIVENRNRQNGSGVAVGDVDGDGRPDVFFAGLEGPDRLYLNRGAWRFENATEAAGLPDGGWSTGAVLVDVDGDRDLDLFVTDMGGPNRLYLNDGSGRFALDPASGLGSSAGSMTAAFADTDGDGDLDAYVANYKRIALRDSLAPPQLLWDRMVRRTEEGMQVVPELAGHYVLRQVGTQMMRLELGEPDGFYRNEGGRFEPMPASVRPPDAGLPGPDGPADWGLSVRLQDFTGDGAPDLYVSNDFESPDYVWENDGTGTFRPVPPAALGHTSNSSMSMDVSDVNRDGLPDFFVADMLSPDPVRSRVQMGTPAPIAVGIGDLEALPQVMHNTLFLADGIGGWAEVGWAFGVAASEWSWSPVFLDVDLDGWEDLLVTTGHSFDVQDADALLAERAALRSVRSTAAFRRLILDFPRLDLPNMAFRNVHGRRFDPQADGWGIGTEDDISHGIALGDFDGDGDLDVVTNRLNAPAGVFRNDASAPRVAVRLRGAGANTAGIGTVVRLVGGPPARPGEEPLIQEKEIVAGGQYLSGSEALVTFAALSDTLRLEVRWRSGRVQILEDVGPNRLYDIAEPDSAPATGRRRSGRRPSARPQVQGGPVFVDRPAELAVHTEVPFEDRDRQPLLMRRLSQEGPAVVVGDLDGDGSDELVIGGGRNGRPAVYRIRANRLTVVPAQGLPVLPGDMAGMAVARTSDGPVLAAGISGYETGDSSFVGIWQMVRGRLVARARLVVDGVVGPVAAGDTDGDGFDELFAGSRFVAGRYPESVPGTLFRREGGMWRAVQTLDTGRATSAAFADMDADGDVDLAVADEWGPVHLFVNEGGMLRDATAERGLAEATGLWRALAWGDVDGDGRLDLVATNWGWNGPYGRVGQHPSDKPVRLYWGDFGRDQTIDPVEAVYRADLDAWSPLASYTHLGGAINGLQRRVGSFHEYAASTAHAMFPDAAVLEAATLAHTVWMNRGDTFERVLLPDRAQWAPASGVVMLDADRDGRLDLALAQNFWPMLPEGSGRQDAGSGLLLFGDGAGGFRGLPLGIEGDHRGIAAMDRGLVMTRNGLPAVYLPLP